ncbi:hypothetical protein HAX54_049597 [Datura stramonium]|uniref:Uncharacterized protein n=1 Tax=Datura stramonium TaxID=4076 RepID=A0ABS8WMT2_DATST|nr:hypothetical protein [Datura stramonium]
MRRPGYSTSNLNSNSRGTKVHGNYGSYGGHHNSNGQTSFSSANNISRSHGVQNDGAPSSHEVDNAFVAKGRGFTKNSQNEMQSSPPITTDYFELHIPSDTKASNIVSLTETPTDIVTSPPIEQHVDVPTSYDEEISSQSMQPTVAPLLLRTLSRIGKLIQFSVIAPVGIQLA